MAGKQPVPDGGGETAENLHRWKGKRAIMIIDYKCPNCAANMVFDSDTGKLHCGSCDYEEEIEGYQKTYESFDTKFHTASYGDEEARQYLCKSCGAVLVTDNHTAATICSFCGSPMILGERISGDYAPTKVIPFSISKEEAEKAFKKWCRKLKFSPKEFTQGNKIKEVVGMYVPFWLYDLRGQGEAQFHCTRTHIYDSGDETITETRHFDVYRQVDLTLKDIPADASEKMADTLMDALEPFDYSGIREFNTPYLAGFLSEKYNYTDKEMLPRVTKRAEQYMDEYVASTIHGYEAVHCKGRDYHIGQLSSEYALFPVWMVYYNYDEAEYTFAMNGQTGKLAGDPPRSIPKIATSVGLATVLFFLVFRIITVLLGGPLL